MIDVRGKGSVCERLLVRMGGEVADRVGKLKGEREDRGVKNGVLAEEGGNWKVEGSAVDGSKV